MNRRVAVIKTAWCDSYTGQSPDGNFAYLNDGNVGAERFNMLPIVGEFRVYTMPKSGNAPVPEPEDGWLVFHVARDPAALRMKLVGWYENAQFVGDYLNRLTGEAHPEGGGYDGSSYCILSTKGFEIAAGDRPVIDHDGRFKMSSIYWMRGNQRYQPKKSWDVILERLLQLQEDYLEKAYIPEATKKPDIGDTRKPAKITDGIKTDDGGDAFGHSDSAESPEHLALKTWAVSNPGFFDYDDDPALTESRPELPLPSGDRVDAAHMNDDYATLIEVKSRRSGEKDIERGIFQCVKYLAVFEAMQKGASSKKQPNTILLVENDVSERLKALADRLKVEIVQHKLEN